MAMSENTEKRSSKSFLMESRKMQRKRRKNRLNLMVSISINSFIDYQTVSTA
jgi:hypothetical protein